MVAELQTEDAPVIDWHSVESVEDPPPPLRLLAKVPRLNDRLRQSLRELPDEVLLLDGQPIDQSSTTVDPNPLERQTESIAQIESQQPHGLSDLGESDAESDADTKSHPYLHPVATSVISNESSWLSRLCELHETMAPYAGLIVTFALFMSAGLLYWLVLGPFTNTNHSQEPTGMGMIGHYSSDSTATTNAPVWPVTSSQLVITEEEPDVAQQKAAHSVSWRQDLNGGPAGTDSPQSYLKKQY